MLSELRNSDVIDVLSNLNRNKNFDGFDDTCLLRIMNAETAIAAAKLLPLSKAQLRQDIFAAAMSRFSKDSGYFVEFGATDGVYLSNSYMLEKSLGWQGILAEPAREWHEALSLQRSARIDHRCVFSRTGTEVMFREVGPDKALSTIVEYAESDLHRLTRRIGETYAVDTVGLGDLLEQHGAPHQIDFLSLDTEGSELGILQAFDFSKYAFGAICCEHNYTDNRNGILDILKRNRYWRVLNGISLFDDWYVHESRLSALAEVFPRWEEVSHQNEIEPGVPQSEKDRVIAMLQETVMNLIVDRDAYKNALEARDPS